MVSSKEKASELLRTVTFLLLTLVHFIHLGKTVKKKKHHQKQTNSFTYKSNSPRFYLFDLPEIYFESTPIYSRENKTKVAAQLGELYDIFHSSSAYFFPSFSALD